MGDQKDLTGLFELPKTEAQASAAPDIVPIEPEKIEEFESLDSLPLLDEAPITDSLSHESENLTQEVSPVLSSFEVSESFTPSPPDDTSDSLAPNSFEEPIKESSNDSHVSFESNSGLDLEETNTLIDLPRFPESSSNITPSSIQASPSTHIRVSFHLTLEGRFSDYAKDKILRAMNEQSFSMGSSEIADHMQAGLLKLSHISEYTAVKLIQDLKDQNLNFKVELPQFEVDALTYPTPDLSFQYDQSSTHPLTPLATSFLCYQGLTPAGYQNLEPIEVRRFVKAALLEHLNPENLESLFLELEQTLYRRAQLKGAHALLNLKREHHPSHQDLVHQIKVSAIILTKLNE